MNSNLNLSSSSEEEVRQYLEQFEGSKIDANVGYNSLRTFSRKLGRHSQKQQISVYPQNSGISIQINNQVSELKK